MLPQAWRGPLAVPTGWGSSTPRPCSDLMQAKPAKALKQRAARKGSPMAGIHHVTAISGNATRDLQFYKDVVGLRFGKKTVNFDDPGTYHFYYGDQVGHPGTILTFFPWEHAASGRAGVGLTQQTAFRIPARSIGYWIHRLIEQGVAHEALERRLDEPVLSFNDPDGMSLALVGAADAESGPTWSAG